MEIHKPIRDLNVSNIEREAKRSAVEAVEARWERQDRIRRRVAFRKALQSYSAIVLLLAIFGGGGYWYMSGGGDVRQAAEKMYASVVADGNETNEVTSLVPAPRLDPKPALPLAEKIAEAVALKSDSADAFRKNYAELASVFQSRPQGYWKDVPASIRPKNMPAGTVYHAAVPRHPAGYDIYGIVTATGGKMTYRLLSPVAAPVSVSGGDFQAACAKGYLIELKGSVYICGKATDAMVKKLQESLGAVKGM